MIALLSGLLAMLLAFATLVWTWRNLFASGGGVFLALGSAYVVGTTAANAVLLGPQRTLRLLCRSLGLSILYAIVLVVATLGTYALLAYVLPRLFASLAGLIASSLIVHAVCTAVMRRRDPTWTRTAGPLWLVALMLMAAYTFTISR